MPVPDTSCQWPEAAARRPGPASHAGVPETPRQSGGSVRGSGSLRPRLPLKLALSESVTCHGQWQRVIIMMVVPTQTGLSLHEHWQLRLGEP
jgi:hypothetical protein